LSQNKENKTIPKIAANGIAAKTGCALNKVMELIEKMDGKVEG